MRKNLASLKVDLNATSEILLECRLIKLSAFVWFVKEEEAWERGNQVIRRRRLRCNWMMICAVRIEWAVWKTSSHTHGPVVCTFSSCQETFWTGSNKCSLAMFDESRDTIKASSPSLIDQQSLFICKQVSEVIQSFKWVCVCVRVNTFMICKWHLIFARMYAVKCIFEENSRKKADLSLINLEWKNSRFSRSRSKNTLKKVQLSKIDRKNHKYKENLMN